jgi:hypothetical protein
MATFSGPTTAGGMYNYQQNAAAGALAMAGLFGASGAVTVPLNGVTGGRHWNVNVSTVGAGGQNSAVSGLGFAETFPQQLSQVRPARLATRHSLFTANSFTTVMG